VFSKFTLLIPTLSRAWVARGSEDSATCSDIHQEAAGVLIMPSRHLSDHLHMAGLGYTDRLCVYVLLYSPVATGSTHLVFAQFRVATEGKERGQLKSSLGWLSVAIEVEKLLAYFLSKYICKPPVTYRKERETQSCQLAKIAEPTVSQQSRMASLLWTLELWCLWWFPRSQLCGVPGLT
jgi:hypothetical protein